MGKKGLYEFDLDSGKIIWVMESSDISSVQELAVATDKNENNLVIFSSDPSMYVRSVHAVELGSSQPLWTIEMMYHHSFTIESFIGDDDILYTFNHASLLKINTRTGKTLNSYEISKCKLDGCTFSKAIVSDSLVVFQQTTGRGALYVLDKSTFSLKYNISSEGVTTNQPIFSDSGKYISQTSFVTDSELVLTVRDSETSKIVFSYSWGTEEYMCRANLDYSNNLIGLAGRTDDDNDARVVVVCEADDYTSVQFFLMEDWKVSFSEIIAMRAVEWNVISDSSDCLYYTYKSYDHSVIQKSCFL